MSVGEDWTSVSITRPRYNGLKQRAVKNKRSIAQELDLILQTAKVPTLEEEVATRT